MSQNGNIVQALHVYNSIGGIVDIASKKVKLAIIYSMMPPTLPGRGGRDRPKRKGKGGARTRPGRPNPAGEKEKEEEATTN